MFGSFRFILAMMVVMTHIGGIEIVAGIAVWGFFMLSGFLMTAVLNKKYGFSANGILNFSISRATRLFPSYWLTSILAVGLVLAFGLLNDPRLINSALGMPESLREYFSNIFIIGHTMLGVGRIENALSPSAWAVDIEIIMYLCSCVFLSKSQKISGTTLLVLLLLFPVLWLGAKGLIEMGWIAYSNQLIYSFIPAALLPYSIGAYIWFRLDELTAYLRTVKPLVLGIVSTFICAFVVSEVSVTLSYILSLPCMAIIIVALSQFKYKDYRSSIDQVLGRMSYPIYLSHWICAYVFVVITDGKGEGFYNLTEYGYRFTIDGFFLVTAIILAFSLLLALVVEGPLERIRHSYSNKKALLSK